MFEEIRNQVLKQARLAETLGLCQSGGGNFSMIDRESGMVCMTPHDTDRFQMSWRDVLVTDLEGNVLEKGPGLKPTSEIEIHLAVYRAREDILAVAHTHAPYTSVFAGLSMEVKPVLTEAMTYYGRAPLAPFGTPSTPQLAENIVKTLGEKGVAAVMEKHGLITASPFGIWDAVRKNLYVEETAKAYFRMIQLVGIEHVPSIDMDELDRMTKMLGIR